MQIKDFTNEDFIQCLKLLLAPYKMKGSYEGLSSLELKKLVRTKHSVSVITRQLLANKYELNNVYKFTNTKDNKIKIEIIDTKGSKTLTDISEKVRPLLAMITKDDKLKGKDWLSRLNYEDLLYFVNKYHRKCSALYFDVNEKAPEHYRWLFLKDENDYYIDTVVFGDYGFFYHHSGPSLGGKIILGKHEIECVFDCGNLEFYNKIIKRLNNADKVEYTKKFISAHMTAFKQYHSDKEFFDKEMKKANIIKQKLLESVKKYEIQQKQ